MFGVGIILFSTLLWLTQPNPVADFSFQNITVPQIVTIPDIDNEQKCDRGVIYTQR
jgi:hypothetical protein